jgi:hypothetical protein
MQSRVAKDKIKSKDGTKKKQKKKNKKKKTEEIGPAKGGKKR